MSKPKMGNALTGGYYVHGTMLGETIRAWGGEDGMLKNISSH